MAANILRYLEINLAQAGADTFKEGSVETEIIPENGLAYQVKAIEFCMYSTISGFGGDSDIKWSLSRDTKASISLPYDPDTMLFDGRSSALTTSGQIVMPNRFYYDQLPGLYIVEPTIYAQLASTSTGLTNAGNFKIYYEEVKLSEIEILRILNNA